MSGREIYSKYKAIIMIIVKLSRLLGPSILSFLFKKSRNVSGKTGIIIRYILLYNLVDRMGDNVSVHQGVYIFNPKNLKIGSNVSIHPMCYIDAKGGIEIGNDVSIAHSCSILSTEHTWADKNIPIKYNEIIYLSVSISSDVWIGCGCRILSGVKIGTRSIIAAGAVVTKPIDSNTIAGGIPAKRIRDM